MTDFYYPVLNDEVNLPLYVLGIGARDREFHFIMGADNWSLINRWKESETLITNYPILIYPRKGYEINIPGNLPDIHKVDAPLMEISSTFIRESLAAGKDVRFFLPEAIRNHKCFSNI